MVLTRFQVQIKTMEADSRLATYVYDSEGREIASSEVVDGIGATGRNGKWYGQALIDAVSLRKGETYTLAWKVRGDATFFGYNIADPSVCPGLTVDADHPLAWTEDEFADIEPLAAFGQDDDFVGFPTDSDLRPWNMRVHFYEMNNEGDQPCDANTPLCGRRLLNEPKILERSVPSLDVSVCLGNLSADEVEKVRSILETSVAVGSE